MFFRYGEIPLLTRFGVRNLKGLEEAEIELRPITILIGSNGSGKSTVAQALLLLKQSLGSTQLIPSGEHVNLGELRDLFFSRELKTPIAFLLEGKRGVMHYREEFEFGEDGISYSSAEFSTSYGPIRVTGEEITPTRITGTDFGIDLAPSNVFPQGFLIKGTSGGGGETRNALRAAVDELNSIFPAIIEDLQRIWYVPPLRGTLRPFHPLEAKPLSNLATPSAADIETRNASWITTLGYTPELLAQVSRWCSDILQTSLKERLVPEKQITLESTGLHHQINIANEGFGLNQLAFLLTQLALAPPDSIVAIDEPEIHLHPRAQARLMQVLVEEAVTNRKTLLLVTHSEHIVYQALTMVGLRDLQPEQLALYHFMEGITFTEGKRCYRARRLPFDHQGRLEQGLPDFFEANIEQYKRYLDILVGKGD